MLSLLQRGLKPVRKSKLLPLTVLILCVCLAAYALTELDDAQLLFLQLARYTRCGTESFTSRISSRKNAFTSGDSHQGFRKKPGTALRALPLVSQAVLPLSFLRYLFTVIKAGFAFSAIGLGALIGFILAGQYGPILRYRKRLPPVDLGLPIIGQSNKILQHGWSGGGRSWLRHLQAKNGPAFVFDLLFVNRIAIDYPLYEQFMLEMERAGKLRPLFSKSMQTLLGKKSILTLPAGKGGDTHAKVRQKVAPALAPRQLALLTPQVLTLCRRTLEDMADETARDGKTTLLPKTNRLTQDVAAASLLGKFADPALPHLEQLGDLIDKIIDGLFTLPVESSFGKRTLFGLAVDARRAACKLIDDLMLQARAEAETSPDVLSRLARDEGEALTAEEIHYTVATIAFAGKVTAAAALPVAVAELAKRPASAEHIASETPNFEEGGNIEHPTAALQFIREAMRLKPPAAAFYRASDEWINLGPHGAVPPGIPVAVCMDYPGAGLSGEADEFKPERWTEEYSRKHFIYFGGTTPHSCPGKGLALLEMQVFLHLLCRDYNFEVLSDETFVDRAFTQVKYKDGLPMRVTRKHT